MQDNKSFMSQIAYQFYKNKAFEKYITYIEALEDDLPKGL